MVSCTAILHWH